MKFVNNDARGFEHAIRSLYEGKGVRRVHNRFEAYLSCRGKFISCGTYATKEEAQTAVITYKLRMFEAGVIAHGDNPSEIVESVDKGYFVSPSGNVYNRHGNLMVGTIDKCGYRNVVLNRKNRNVHRVIAETFIPNPNNLPCVNHKDGKKLNNSVDNLEWCTYSENTLHSFKTGLQKKIHNQYGEFEVKKYGN